MSKYHVLNIRQDMWDEIVTKSETLIGVSPSNLAKQYLLEGLHPQMTYTPFKDPPKTGVAPKEIKKITSSRKGKKFLFHSKELGLTNWVYRSDDENLYDTYFYFCEKRNFLREDSYGPLFRTDRYTDFSSDDMELAKCMVIERDEYLRKLNVPRETAPEKDFTEYDEAVKKRKEKMDELKEG